MAKENTEEQDVLSLVAGGRPGGRMLFAALAIGSAVLLILVGSQTEPGAEDGGWWNEPRNGPIFALSLMFVFSVLAAIFAASAEKPAAKRLTVIALLLSAGFLASIWLMGLIGYGLSVLAFCAFCAAIAGFRGRRLAAVAGGLALTMLVLFRFVLGLWFPKAALFKLTPWLETLGSFL